MKSTTSSRDDPGGSSRLRSVLLAAELQYAYSGHRGVQFSQSLTRCEKLTRFAPLGAAVSELSDNWHRARHPAHNKNKVGANSAPWWRPCGKGQNQSQRCDLVRLSSVPALRERGACADLPLLTDKLLARYCRHGHCSGVCSLRWGEGRGSE